MAPPSETLETAVDFTPLKFIWHNSLTKAKNYVK